MKDAELPEFHVWCGMIQRCTNRSDPRWKNYGGRGITVCRRWRGERGFANFYVDMGPRPSAEHSIDRRNNNRGYQRSNCRWATDLQQAQNTRRTRKISTAAEGLYYARNLLGWSRETLAEASGTATLTLTNYEVNGSDPLASTVQKWWRALMEAGIEFSDEEPCIRLRTKPHDALEDAIAYLQADGVTQAEIVSAMCDLIDDGAHSYEGGPGVRLRGGTAKR